MITLMKLERSLSSKQLVQSCTAASCPTQPCSRTPPALLSAERPCHQRDQKRRQWPWMGCGMAPGEWGGGLHRPLDSRAGQLSRY